MKKIMVIVLLGGLFLQGCQTTRTTICKMCHPDEAAQAQAAAHNHDNPVQRADKWIKKNLW